MAFKMSTGLRNSLMGAQDVIAGTNLAITNGTTVTDSGGGFLTAGFRPGDTLIFTGWPEAANNTIICTCGTVIAGTLTVSGATLTVDAGASGTPTITACAKTFKDIFRNNVIRVYSGAKPADADAAEGAGVLLLELSKSSGVVTPGAAANGNNFDAIVDGVLSKDANVWSDAGIADGAAAWYRMYDNGIITGASDTAKRCDGTVSTSGTTFILSSTSIKTGATTTLDQADFTMPAS